MLIQAGARRLDSESLAMTESKTIILPWPPKELSPNARVHWAKKASAVKSYRKTCWIMALSHSVVRLESTIRLKVTFSPPDKRSRDLDNCIASVKAMFDGLADAWKVNDRQFSVEYNMGKPLRRGEVIVEIVG